MDKSDGAEIVRGDVEQKGLASATQRERCATRTLRPICERQDQEQGCDDVQDRRVLQDSVVLVDYQTKVLGTRYSTLYTRTEY